MKIRKQFSYKYQVVELEEDCEDLEVAKTIGNLMDEVGKQQLADMAKVIDELDGEFGEAKTAKSVPVQKQSGSMISPKQATTIKNQLQRAIKIARSLGIRLDKEEDVDNLTAKEASAIIGEFFKGNKSNTGF